MANKEPTGRVAGWETIVGEGTAQERIGATSGVSVTNHSGAAIENTEYRLVAPPTSRDAVAAIAVVTAARLRWCCRGRWPWRWRWHWRDERRSEDRKQLVRNC